MRGWIYKCKGGFINVGMHKHGAALMWGTFINMGAQN